ncbi:dynamin family protein [Pelomyxa schiedti]|nr:dynamin family protein [Pelomyxa schiedti]
MDPTLKSSKVSSLWGTRLSVDLAQLHDGGSAKPSFASVVTAAVDSSIPRPSVSAPTKAPGSAPDELRLLSAITPDQAAMRTMYKGFQADVLGAFGKLVAFARETNVTMEPPQIVFVGQKGVGKTSILEAILGKPLFMKKDGSYSETNRPIIVSVVYNSECSTNPKITVRRDPFMKDSTNVEVPLASLPDVLQEHNAETEMPLTIIYETADSMNVTFVDTPGLLNENDPKREQRDELVQRLIGQTSDATNRLIVCVSMAAAWPCWLHSWVRRSKTGGYQARTSNVFVESRDHFKKFTNAGEANKYLSERPTDSFFVTLPSSELIATTRDQMQQLIYQSSQLDIKMLNDLHFDKNHDKCVGTPKLISFVNSLVLRTYQQYAPLIKNHQRLIVSNITAAMQLTIKKQANLTPFKLRGTAMNYLTQFVHSIETVIQDGTLENLPPQYGTTTADEWRLLEDRGEKVWHMPGSVSADEWNIPAWSRPLFGRQQMERLLSEFRILISRTKIIPISHDEIAIAAGSLPLSDPATFLHAAFDVAQQRLPDQLTPVIKQLQDRAAHIMRAVCDLAHTSIKNPKRRVGFQRTPTASTPAVVEQELEYPFFIHWVSRKFFMFVENLVKTFAEQCANEIASTKFLLWEEAKFTGSLKGAQIEDAVNLASQAFDNMKQIVAQNIMLKCHSTFLEQPHMWGELQSSITMELTEELLNELFEVPAEQKRLEQESAELTSLKSHLDKQDAIVGPAISILTRK